MLEASRRWRRDGRSIGLVPTMGALHAGHTRLVDTARAENDVVVVSVFVNPIQFGPQEDFGRYPRDWERDLKVLEVAEVDAVYRPSAAEMYPPDATTRVRVGGIADALEGTARPGHFEGVATVVTKLTAPTSARRTRSRSRSSSASSGTWTSGSRSASCRRCASLTVSPSARATST